MENIRYKRFLTGKSVAYRDVVIAAEDYVASLKGDDIGWIKSKPYDLTPGNPQYFRLMYEILNLLQSMQIKPSGHVLEIGCGPGWITEILLMLGYQVEVIEPSKDFLKIAEDRCKSLKSHYDRDVSTKINFHLGTLETLNLPDSSIDAIIFFDVLHHVYDEFLAIDKCFRFLKPGGSIGITEGSWHPDFKALEQSLMNEMKRFGTLENPFSTEYLDNLLVSKGFHNVQRFSSVNGFFPVEQLNRPLTDFTISPPSTLNNLVAWKPGEAHSTFQPCTNLTETTAIEMTLESGGIDPKTLTASLNILLKNTGNTLLENNKTKQGFVNVALRRGEPGTPDFSECGQRHALPSRLAPGESLTIKLDFTLPADTELDCWVLDLVAEGAYWFSSRGISACPIISI